METGDNIEGEGASHVTTDRNGHAELTLNNNNQAHNNHNSLSNPTVMIVFCVGLVVLLAIGITGCCVLQRQQVY